MAISTALIRGSTQLVFDCVSGITTAAESMHRTIAGSSTSWLIGLSDFRPLKEIRNPIAYSMVRKVSDTLNQGVIRTLAIVQNHSDLSSMDRNEVHWVAALNGVCGDHLEAEGNVLAIPMEFIGLSETAHFGAAEAPPASPHIVVMVHGLCLSDYCWQGDENPGLGAHLKQELGMTPVYLRYNTGRHISSNGKELSRLLDELLAAWPVPVESLSLVGHSMGGLVIRSACLYADTEHRAWLQSLKRILFLGSPHHGSPLEKAGHLLETAMQSIKYVEPLMFGRKRSAGIKDLRHGNLLEENWQRPDGKRHDQGPRKNVPLLPSVDHYFVAASIGRDEKDLMGHLFGDLLVRVDSALRNGSSSAGEFGVNEHNCRVFQEQNHFDLLNDAAVHAQVAQWFSSTTNDTTRQHESAGNPGHLISETPPKRGSSSE